MVTIGRRPGAAAPTAEEPAGPRGSRYRGADTENFEHGATEGTGRAARGGRSRTAEPEQRSSRARGRNEEEETAPKRTASKGWAGSKKVRQETFDDKRFKLPEDDPVLIYFMEDEPFDSAPAHFLRNIPGQKLFICPGKKPKEGYPSGCPLCRIGDSASARSYFNIVVFDEAGEGDLKVWEAGSGYSKEIEAKTKSRIVNGKLSSVYFEVIGIPPAGGKGHGATKLQIDAVAERDVEEYYHFQPLSDTEYEEFAKDLQGEGYIKYPTNAALEAAAKQLDVLGD